MPITLGFICERGLDQINYILAGHYLDENEIGTIAISATIMVMLMFYPIVGLLLFSQNNMTKFYSSKQYDMFQKTFNRLAGIMFYINCFTGVILFFSSPILQFFGITEEIAQMSQNYIRVAIIGNFFNYQRYSMKIICTSTLNPGLAAYFLPIVIIAQILQGYVYLHLFNFGYMALAYASCVSYLIGALIQYLIIKTHRDTKQFDYDLSLMGPKDCWDTFIQYKFVWAMKLIGQQPQVLAQVFSSAFSSTATAAVGIVNVAVYLNIILGQGTSVSQSVFISKAIAQKDTFRAKRWSIIIFTIFVSLSALLALCVSIFSTTFIGLMTTNPTIQAEAE